MALVSIFRPTSHLPSQLCSPRSVAFWMAHLALSVALATMVLAMSSTMSSAAPGAVTLVVEGNGAIGAPGAVGWAATAATCGRGSTGGETRPFCVGAP